MTNEEKVKLVRDHARNNLHLRDGYWQWVIDATDDYILSVIGDRQTERGIIGKCADPQWRGTVASATTEVKRTQTVTRDQGNPSKNIKPSTLSTPRESPPPSEIDAVISPDLIERRLNNFWGYGSFDAPVWFVGMEDGLGDTENELKNRFIAGDGKQTIDIRKDMQAVPGHMKFYTSPGPLQPTLMFPIALSLYIKFAREPTQDEIRFHQQHELGDVKKGISSSFDLMPLPSRSASGDTWLYYPFGIDSLASRKIYLETHLPRRVLELNRMVAQHRPQLIIFYSTGYKSYWDEVMNSPSREITKQMYFGQTNNTPSTYFCIVPQRNSFGMSKARIHEFAEEITKIAPELHRRLNAYPSAEYQIAASGPQPHAASGPQPHRDTKKKFLTDGVRQTLGLIASIAGMSLSFYLVAFFTIESQYVRVALWLVFGGLTIVSIGIYMTVLEHYNQKFFKLPSTWMTVGNFVLFVIFNISFHGTPWTASRLNDIGVIMIVLMLALAVGSLVSNVLRTNVFFGIVLTAMQSVMLPVVTIICWFLPGLLAKSSKTRPIKRLSYQKKLRI